MFCFVVYYHRYYDRYYAIYIYIVGLINVYELSNWYGFKKDGHIFIRVKIWGVVDTPLSYGNVSFAYLLRSFMRIKLLYSKILRRKALFLTFFIIINTKFWFYVETVITCILINLNTNYFINTILFIMN